MSHSYPAVAAKAVLMLLILTTVCSMPRLVDQASQRRETLVEVSIGLSSHSLAYASGRAAASYAFAHGLKRLYHRGAGLFSERGDAEDWARDVRFAQRKKIELIPTSGSDVVLAEDAFKVGYDDAMLELLAQEDPSIMSLIQNQRRRYRGLFKLSGYRDTDPRLI